MTRQQPGLPGKRRVILLLAALVLIAVLVLLGFVVQPFSGETSSTSLKADAALLKKHVRALSVDFHPRSFDQPKNLMRAAAFIQEQFAAAGATVSVQDVVVEGATYQNVIAKFGPAQGPLLVIGAHYDSHGDVTGALQGRTATPGADDNASGVAGLLELARLLGRQPQARPIELVAYALEEPPHFRTEHMGSVWHARSLKAAGREVSLMLSLEMIGYFRDEANSQSYLVPGMSLLYPDRANFIALVGQFRDFQSTRQAKSIMQGATDLPVHSINAPRSMQGIDYSDHRSYWLAGYPALMVTDTSFLRNRHYHSPDDTADTLDYGRMANVVEAVYALTQHYR